MQSFKKVEKYFSSSISSQEILLSLHVDSFIQSQVNDFFDLRKYGKISTKKEGEKNEMSTNCIMFLPQILQSHQNHRLQDWPSPGY